LNPILDELMKEGRISITGKDKNIIEPISKLFIPPLGITLEGVA